MKRPIDETIGSWGACAPGENTWTVSGKSTWWDAALEYANEWDTQGLNNPTDQIEVWEELAPRDPVEFLHASRIIDGMDADGHEHYFLDVCDNWPPETTTAQDEDLETEVRKVVGAWLDKHKLRPAWKVGGRSWVVTYDEAKARAEAAKEAE